MASSPDLPERTPRADAIRALIADQQQRPSSRRAEVVLGEAASLARQIKELHQKLDKLVIEGKATGATWSQIGIALGVTAQTAHRRYSPSSLQAELERQNRLRATARGELPLDGVQPKRRTKKQYALESEA